MLRSDKISVWGWILDEPILKSKISFCLYQSVSLVNQIIILQFHGDCLVDIFAIIILQTHVRAIRHPSSTDILQCLETHINSFGKTSYAHILIIWKSWIHVHYIPNRQHISYGMSSSSIPETKLWTDVKQGSRDESHLWAICYDVFKFDAFLSI